MLTLGQFANADSIAQVYIPIVEKQFHLIIYFGLVWLVVTIKLMNLVTAVIVDQAITQGNEDRELQLSMKRRRWMDLEPDIKDVFRELDVLQAGQFTVKYVRDGLDGMSAAFMKSLPADLNNILDSEQLVELYDYVDTDRSGGVDEVEFVNGIFSLMFHSVPMETTQMLHLLRSHGDMLQRIHRRIRSNSTKQLGMIYRMPTETRVCHVGGDAPLRSSQLGGMHPFKHRRSGTGRRAMASGIVPQRVAAGSQKPR